MDDVGKLDEDYQVIPDNDYYQNLSYSVKSTKTYDEIVDTVNRLVHPVGLKNFADTQILSSSSSPVVGDGFGDIAVFDLIDERRVDTISNYDLVQDQDLIINEGRTYSKFIKFKSKKLSDYIECRTNRVLTVDNIGPQFSNSNNAEKNKKIWVSKFQNILEIIPTGNGWKKYLKKLKKWILNIIVFRIT